MNTPLEKSPVAEPQSAVVTSSTACAVRLQDVSKAFVGRVAVNRLSLAIPEGSIYGFIGPNGSGKTTTLRMILNIIVPDSGRIEIFGKTAIKELRDRIAYLPEERGLYKRVEVRRVLRYYGRLKGVPKATLEARIDDWLERLNLTSHQHKKIEALSKGMAQKVQFISAVIAEPALLILDEPFSGLDPVNMEVLKDSMIEMRRRGSTVIFSTHDMNTAEKLCDRIFMIFNGNKVLDGTLDEIQSRYGSNTVRLRTAGGSSVLTGLPEVEAFNDDGRLQQVRLRGDAQAFLRRLVERTTVYQFELARPSLHDIFVEIAGPGSKNTARGASHVE